MIEYIPKQTSYNMWYDFKKKYKIITGEIIKFYDDKYIDLIIDNNPPEQINKGSLINNIDNSLEKKKYILVVSKIINTNNDNLAYITLIEIN